MELVKVEVEVPKEMKEVADFIVGLVQDIKEKKSVTAIAAENLPALMGAVQGFESLSAESKSEQAYALYGLLVGDLIKALK